MAARTDRRAHMERQFQKLGLHAIRVEGASIAEVRQELANIRPSAAGSINGHMACTFSHYEIWKAFLATSADAALILEDDAVLSPDLPDFLRALEDEAPEGVDLIKIETFHMKAKLSSQVRNIAGREASRLFGTHYGACGYIIYRHLAKQLLNDCRRFDLIIDNYLFSRDGPVIYKYNVYQLKIALSIQLFLYSELSEIAAASNDLEIERSGWIRQRQLKDRLNRLRTHLKQATTDAIYFGYDLKGLLGERHDIPFSDVGELVE